MAPAQGKPQRAHIVRSGNAGNSSKPNPSTTAASTAAVPPLDNRPPPLFPPGAKTPLKLLQERCSHNGWEKPSVESKRSGQGFTAVVFLRKKDKKDASIVHSVRMEPHPPLDRSTAEQAKHWGATYALHRFCNNLSLHRVLPIGPKDYWAELEKQKKTAPAHRAWEFDPDPFTAAVEVKKRQQAREVQSSQSHQTSSSTTAIAAEIETKVKASKTWSRCPEVKMDQQLRDQTEQVIRRVMATWSLDQSDPTISTNTSSQGQMQTSEAVHSIDRDRLFDDFVRMGFRSGHVKTALQHLSKLRGSHSNLSDSHLATTLMKTFLGGSDRDALLQYLTLIVPEDDLPIRFRPTNNSTAFVTGTSGPDTGSASSNLRKAWILNRLTKTYGFPIHAAEEVLTGPPKVTEGTAVEMLARRLAGWPTDLVQAQVMYVDSCESNSEVLRLRDEKRQSEKEALLSIYGEESCRVVPEAEETDFEIIVNTSATGGKDDLRLRVSFHAHSLYPSPTSLLSTPIIPTFSIVSATLPSYIRLSLLKMLMEQFREPQKGWSSMIEFGDGGVIFEMINSLEEHWQHTVQDPPDVAEVMFNFVVSKQSTVTASTSNSAVATSRSKISTKAEFTTKPLRRNRELDQKLLHSQESMRSKSSYGPMSKARQSLPAWSSREEFLHALKDPACRALVVAGETGSGKTTQLPQFVMESEIDENNGSMVNIICTQPRRVSAIGVATRVAGERLETIDDKEGLVGYTIRGEKKSGPQTRLLFATTGVLLRRLATSDPDLKSVSHVFVDEVHERNLESDLLLLELRQLLKRNLRIKIILMSATANQELFSNYFGHAAMIKIAGITFPVKDLYLEDYLCHIDYNPSMSRRKHIGSSKTRQEVEGVKADGIGQYYRSMNYDDKHIQLLESASKTSRDFDEILVASVVAHILKQIKIDPVTCPPGVILIFVSGVAEIGSACKAIERLCGGQVDCLPLHSQLSTTDQKRVFSPPRPSKIKIVVSTNIAETSITIPDVRYVIDTGREKQIMLDAEIGMTRLSEVNCSRAAARQRRGRAGRTASGFAYKLYTRLCEQNAMRNDTEPEMLRTPLEALFLQVKAIREHEDVPTYLKEAITPPPQSAVEQAIETLERVGAFHDGRLTALGKHLAQLPLDLRLGKLLIFGAIFKVFEVALTLAAMLSVNKPLFNSPFDRRDEANNARLKFSTANSDLLTNITAFNEFVKIKTESGNAVAHEFASANFLSFNTIRDIISARADLLAHVQERGFVPRDYQLFGRQQGSPNATTTILNANLANLNLVKSVFLAGLTQVARIDLPDTKYDQVANGTVAKDVDSKSVKFYDPKLGRVFLHPSSILFKSANNLKAGFLTYFSRSVTSAAVDTKVFLRDATEVPLFGTLLLYGSGSIKIHPQLNGLSIQVRAHTDSDHHDHLDSIKLRAPLRIGTLCNQLRHLIDALLQMAIDRPGRLGTDSGQQEEKDVIDCVVRLIETDGLVGAL